MGSAKPAYLYVIADGTGAHKVGLSARPRHRLSQLQVGASRRLTLVRTSEQLLDDPGAVEDYAHWLLREARQQGEWFNVTAEAAWVALVAATEAVERGLSVPPKPKPEPKKRGRPKNEHEPVLIRFRPGTMERVDAVLVGSETRADFVRQAVEDAVKRRSRHRPAKSDTGPEDAP